MENRALDMSKRLRLGLGSYAYRYAIGFGDFVPKSKMTVFQFIEEAVGLGFGGIQLCENLNFAKLSNSELYSVGKMAKELGIFVELGMKDISPESMERHLEIADLVSSSFLRVVLGSNSSFPERDPSVLRDKSIKVLRDMLERCRTQGVAIGIENHFDIPNRELVEIVKEVNDKCIGFVLDTTNSLGFFEKPEVTLKTMEPHIISLHLKDYISQKVEAGYMITGTVLGKGLLDVRQVLENSLKNNPVKSIIMEMTIRRKDTQSMQEVLDWERESIKQSFEYLQKTVSSLEL